MVKALLFAVRERSGVVCGKDEKLLSVIEGKKRAVEGSGGHFDEAAAGGSTRVMVLVLRERKEVREVKRNRGEKTGEILEVEYWMVRGI